MRTQILGCRYSASSAWLATVRHLGLKPCAVRRTQRRLCIINCLWIFDCLRAWRLLPEGKHMHSTHLTHHVWSLLLQQLQYCPCVDMAPPASSRRLRTLRQSRQVYTLMH